MDNSLVLTNFQLPQIIESGYYTASNPFFHANRTLSFHVLILVVEGVIYVTEDGTDYEIRPGELLFLKAGVNHFGKMEIPKKTKWYFLHFFMEQSQENDKSKYKRIIPKYLCDLKDSDIEKDIAQIVNDFYSLDFDVHWDININLYNVFTKMIEKGNHPKKLTLSDKIADYIEANHAKVFDIAELEDIFCLSYKRMAAVFKKEKGMSMLQFCMECRINHACKLLQLTDLNIGEIASIVGYEDQLYFSRIFRKLKKMSPKKWRQNSMY